MTHATRALGTIALLLLAHCGGAPVHASVPPAAPPPSPPAHEDVAIGLSDSLVVCATCTPQLLDAKREGILHAMTVFKAYAGSDMLPDHAPVTFHLDSDAVCGTSAAFQAQHGFLTGNTFNDAHGRAHVCLFDVEKQQRALAFTTANARRLLDQLLPLHEAMHLWLDGRSESHEVQEVFSKMTSLVVSGSVPDPCTGFRTHDPPENLIGSLCEAGFEVGELPELLRRIAAAVRRDGRAISIERFISITSAVIGVDTTRAFRAAGALRTGR